GAGDSEFAEAVDLIRLQEQQFRLLTFMPGTLAQAGGADAVMPINMLSEQAAARSLPLEPRQTMYLVLAVNPSRNLPQPAQALEEQIEAAFMGFM
ncbi:MAG: hypothetical protein IJ337_09300, partial [Clostridia bacterium]|nr:hypothetical protein [Clostridia bacterium]